MDSNEDIEIDLLRLCRFILSKWKIILFSGVLFALLGFSYKYLGFKYSSVPLAELDKQFEVEFVEAQLDGKQQKVKKKVSYNIYKEDYDARMADYNAQYATYKVNKKVLSDLVENASMELEMQKEFLINSKLFNAGDDGYYETVIFYTVRDLLANTNTNTNTNTTQHPAVTYVAGLLSSNQFLSQIFEKLNLNGSINTKLVSELIHVRVKDLNSFEIVVRGDKEELVSSLLGEIEFLNSALKEFCGTFCDFTRVKISSGKVNPAFVKQYKQNAQKHLYDLENKLSSVQKNQKALIEPVKFEDYDKFMDLEKFKLFKYIKLTLIGFVFGLFLPIGIYVLKYLLDGRLKDENYVTNAFRINKIACIHSRDGIKSDARAVETVDSNLAYVISKGHKSVVFVSTLCGIKEQKLTEIASLIDKYNNQNGVSVKLVAPGAILEIDSADTVIIAERLDVSDFNAVVDEVKNVLAVKEKIYGIVYA